MSNREAIMSIVWKRVSDNSIIIAYHPLKSHPKVEDKDGNSVIRAQAHLAYHVTQTGDGITEVKWCYHINFGGNLPRAAVNGFVIPISDRTVSHFIAYFANLISLSDLTKADGKLLGEIWVNSLRKARKRGAWKKRAELGKVGVDEFFYVSVAMREILPKHPWLRSLLHEISLN